MVCVVPLSIRLSLRSELVFPPIVVVVSSVKSSVVEYSATNDVTWHERQSWNEAFQQINRVTYHFNAVLKTFVCERGNFVNFTDINTRDSCYITATKSDAISTPSFNQTHPVTWT